MSGCDTSAGSCMHCAIKMQEHDQHYQLSDVGPELVTVIEKSHASMDVNEDILCDGCFSTFLIRLSALGAALINAYHPTIVDRPDAQLILNRALRFKYVPKYLSEYVVQNNLNRRRAQFQRIDGDLPQIRFPNMTTSELILFGLGVYQLKQAKSYFGEHIRENGSFTIEMGSNIEIVNVPGLSSSQCTKLFRGRIKSRHHSGKVYYTYVLINENMIPSWEESICGYYCSCVCGKRTVGCCAHVMTIVWYMGWARHQEIIHPPAEFLDDLIIRDDIENE